MGKSPWGHRVASPHARDSKVPVGEVTPAVLDSSLISARNSQGLCPANSSQVLQHRCPLLASEEPEALPVRKGCQEAGDMARLGSD